MKRPTMWMAELETTNFSFRAFGVDQDLALKALRRGWAVHRRQYGAGRVVPFDRATGGGEQSCGSVEFFPINMGAAYRDGEPLR